MRLELTNEETDMHMRSLDRFHVFLIPCYISAYSPDPLRKPPFPFELQRTSKLALSTSCSKFPEKLLLFKKVTFVNFNHAYIHLMINYSLNVGPNERFSKRRQFSVFSLDVSLHFVTLNLRCFLTVSYVFEIFINKATQIKQLRYKRHDARVLQSM